MGEAIEGPTSLDDPRVEVFGRRGWEPKGSDEDESEEEDGESGAMDVEEEAAGAGSDGEPQEG